MLEYQHLFAGVSGGFVSTLVVHPLDLLRIRFAVNEGDAQVRPQYGGYIQTAKALYRAKGCSGFYQGVAPNLWGATLSWGLYFMLYNSCRDFIKEYLNIKQLSFGHNFAAGSITGAALLCVTNPLWVAKTRLCLQYETKQRKYEGSLRQTLMTILRQEGIRGWYRGFVPGLLGTSHGAIQFTIYEELKKHSHALNLPSPVQSTVFSGISKILAVVVTYPYQVVRARLQDQHVQYKGVVDVIVRTHRREGVLGFYKGLVASLLRVTPAACVTFVVYEEVNKLLR